MKKFFFPGNGRGRKMQFHIFFHLEIFFEMVISLEKIVGCPNDDDDDNDVKKNVWSGMLKEFNFSGVLTTLCVSVRVYLCIFSWLMLQKCKRN